MKETKESNIGHKKQGTSRGITLIALVITIIVMLILVAVTITMAIKGGLFEHAGKAAGDTQNAIKAEQNLAGGQVAIDGQTYNSIDEYVNGDTSKGEMISFTIDGEKFTTKRGTTWEEFAPDSGLDLFCSNDVVPKFRYC